MIIAKPFIPNLNVDEVPAVGLQVTIVSVTETTAETKAAVENAKEYTLTFTSEKLSHEKFPEGRGQRMFSAASPLARELAIISGQKQDSDGNYPIDETRLPGKKITLIPVPSAGKFSNQKTLTIKK